MKSENKNFLMNVVYQGLTLVFPLVTVPYVSRVLGVENVGIYSYTYSIANIFMLLGMLGINNYGNREIAKVRDNVDALAREFSSIYGLQVIISVAAVVGYVVYLLTFGSHYRLISVLQLVSVLSICFDVNWFFFGLEKFRLSITRNLFVKVVSLVLILLFVRDRSDLWVYTAIMAGSTALSQVYLFCILHRYVRFKTPTWNAAFRHFRGVIVLFVPVLAFGVYQVLDKTMLGTISTVTELGYFANAEKVVSIPIAVVAALGTVMLPRMAHIFVDRTAEYRATIKASMNLALMLACTMGVGMMVIAEDATPIVFGPGFERCAPVIRLLSVTVMISAWSNVVRTQYLIPANRDSVYVGSTLGAAVVNVSLNLVLIGRFGAIGACVGTIAAELFIAVYQTIATLHELDAVAYLRILAAHLGKGTAMALIAVVAASFFTSHGTRLGVMLACFGTLFMAFNFRFIMRDFLGVRS